MKHYNIIIIGGGISGLTAAIYSSRAGKSVLVIEGSGIGGQIATSPTVENYPGFEKISGLELSDRLYSQAEALGAEIDFDTAVKIIPGKPCTVTTEYSEYSCDSLIIATGAHHRRAGLDREEELTGKGISYCAVCDGALYKGKTVAVLGGGNTALTAAIYLSAICHKVYLIHRRDTYRADEELVERVANTENIIQKKSSRVENLYGGNELEGISVNGERLDTSALFVCVGQVPSSTLVDGLLELDHGGYIISDESCRTKYDNIFVCGDVRTKSARQLTTAAADGTVAALGACKF